MSVKDRIAAIDASGRAFAAKINERISAEGLLGQSPATIRRVEEIVESVLDEDIRQNQDIERTRFEFAIMKGGIAAAPLVTLARYTGRVGS